MAALVGSWGALRRALPECVEGRSRSGCTLRLARPEPVEGRARSGCTLRRARPESVEGRARSGCTLRLARPESVEGASSLRDVPFDSLALSLSKGELAQADSGPAHPESLENTEQASH